MLDCCASTDTESPEDEGGQGGEDCDEGTITEAAVGGAGPDALPPVGHHVDMRKQRFTIFLRYYTT